MFRLQTSDRLLNYLHLHVRDKKKSGKNSLNHAFVAMGPPCP